MKTTIMNLIVVSALSFSGTALAAGEMVGRVQPPAAKPAASAVPPTPTAKPAAPVQTPQPASKPAAPVKPTQAKPPRSKSLDLRHCLDLETDAAIAKCAGE